MSLILKAMILHYFGNAENGNSIIRFFTNIVKTNFRNTDQIFGIKPSDRLLYTFVIGKTGTGKTTLLK